MAATFSEYYHFDLFANETVQIINFLDKYIQKSLPAKKKRAQPKTKTRLNAIIPIYLAMVLYTTNVRCHLELFFITWPSQVIRINSPQNETVTYIVHRAQHVNNPTRYIKVRKTRR